MSGSQEKKLELPEIPDGLEVEDKLYDADKVDQKLVYKESTDISIPDIAQLTGTIIEFVEYLSQPQVIEMSKGDEVAYKQHLENKFEDFSLKYYSIFRMLLEEKNRAENLNKLISMMEILKNIKDGKKDHDKEFEKFKEERAEEYIYPQFGGKNNFQRVLAQRAREKELEDRKNKNKKNK